MHDPIQATLGWYFQRVFYFAAGCVVLTIVSWQSLMVNVYSYRFVDALLLAGRILNRQADLTSSVMLGGCAVVSILGMVVLYQGIALWWRGRSQLDLHTRGSRLGV